MKAADSIEQTIARHVVETKFEDLPPEAVLATKEHILHTLGTVLAGSPAPGIAELVGLLEETGGTPESTILGWGIKVPAAHAAMANGTMGHAMDFDNNDDRIAYKSSVCAVPSALAVAERIGSASGKELITATCIGIDLGIRMGLAVQPYPAHSQSPELGPFAAAAATAKLLGLNEDQTWDALGLALCGVALLGVSTGGLTYTKRFVAGAASRNGIFAALLAAKGFRARQGVFSGPGNFYRGAWDCEADTDRLLEGLGKRFEVINVGPKPYPSCRYTHGPIDGALALRAGNAFRIEDVEQVQVSIGVRDYEGVFGGAAGLDTKQQPQSIVDAQFSIPYTVATAMMQGKVFFEDFTAAAIRRPEIVALACKVVPIVRKEFDSGPEDVKPCQVEVLTRDGRRHVHHVEYAKGNPRKPVPHEEIRSNFMACAERTPKMLERVNVERARELIETLETVKDAAEIAALLSPVAAEPAGKSRAKVAGAR
ncbi:MAG: MmgE/PrpD family protein [Betaproteobacteria bacterium]|nr:MmgE/PrpD family protein [Betaproteobacteria bacterium]